MTSRFCNFLALRNAEVQRHTRFTVVASDPERASLLHPQRERARPRQKSA